MKDVLELAKILSKENNLDLDTNIKLVKKYNLVDYCSDAKTYDLAEQLQDAYKAEFKITLRWHEANVIAKKLMYKSVDESLENAKNLLKENGYILEDKNDIIGNLVDLEVLNNRLQRLDKGWHFDVSRCNSTARVFVIEKEDVGYFRFSVLLSMVRSEAGNDTLLSRARLLGYEKEEDSQKNMDNICAMLFKEED